MIFIKGYSFTFTRKYSNYSIRKFFNNNTNFSYFARQNKYLFDEDINFPLSVRVRVRDYSILVNEIFPWKITPSIIKAQENLCTFYEWLNSNYLEESGLNLNKTCVK